MYSHFGIKFCTLATMPLMAIFCYNESLLSGIFMQLCKTVKKRQLAHVFVYRIGHVDFAEQFRQ